MLRQFRMSTGGFEPDPQVQPVRVRGGEGACGDVAEIPEDDSLPRRRRVHDLRRKYPQVSQAVQAGEAGELSRSVADAGPGYSVLHDAPLSRSLSRPSWGRTGMGCRGIIAAGVRGEISPTRRTLTSAPTSPASGRGQEGITAPSSSATRRNPSTPARRSRDRARRCRGTPLADDLFPRPSSFTALDLERGGRNAPAESIRKGRGDTSVRARLTLRRRLGSSAR